ncbi:MAG: flagellar FlbD family protein [Bdellovibrionaceae bacterium]|nr:flagellar FlbD family protein [Pseudobdellovibrionaceae bacterium]
MIEVNKLNGTTVYVNPDLIRYLESAGDTVLVFMDGETLIIRQTPDEVIARIVAFRKRCDGLPNGERMVS